MEAGNLSEKKRDRMICFLETLRAKNKDDKEVLKAISEIERALNEKKYGLVWEEHEEEVDRMLENNIPVFDEITDLEIIEKEDDGYNFLLEGDNLHSLKLLEKTHKGKIDVIYIDPPYNTENKEFIYNDDMVGKEDNYRHSKWLSFMHNRITIAKKLLSDSGLIFISINDCEMANIKLLCDEIFGENNFVENFIWVKNSGGSLSNTTLTRHEYVLTYAKNIVKSYSNSIYLMLKPGYYEVKKIIESGKVSNKSIEEIEKEIRNYYKTNDALKGIKLYNNVDENYNCFRTLPITAPNNQYYDVLHPLTKKPVKVPPRGWSWNKDTMMKNIELGKVLFGKDETYGISQKLFLDDAKYEHKRSTYGCDQAEGNKVLKEVLGKNVSFDNPKPISLIKYLLQNTDRNITIMDFFAGSGTTAQAVLELNKEDGGNRKFILCTNNENNICEEVTYERIKTVITGKRRDGSEYSEGIPANLKYYKTSFVPKGEDYMEDSLNKYVKELIELEKGKSLDNGYKIILSDEEADELEKNIALYDDLKELFISDEVLLTTSQKVCFKNIKKNIIPEYYYKDAQKM